MKKLLVVCVIALLASPFGCGKTISDGFTVDKKTGLDVNWGDLMDVSDGANTGNFEMPIEVGGHTTFEGTENNVKGEQFLDQTGVPFHVINGNVEALRGYYYADRVTRYNPDYPMSDPVGETIWWKSSFSTGQWINDDFYGTMVRGTNLVSDYPEMYKGFTDADIEAGNITHQLIWYAMNNPNYGMEESGFGTTGYDYADQAIYGFDITVSATLIVTGTGLDPAEDFSTAVADINEADSYQGQVAGMTIGFVDADLNQNGGILVKVMDCGNTTDYLILQVPDVTADGALMNIPYPLDGNPIVQGTPFTITLDLSGSSVSQGPNIRIYLNDEDMNGSPLEIDDTGEYVFDNDIYGDYVSNTGLIGIVEAALGKTAWSALWEGGSALGSDIPGCINPKTQRAVYIIDLGVNINEDAEDPYQRSAQVAHMEVATELN